VCIDANKNTDKNRNYYGLGIKEKNLTTGWWHTCASEEKKPGDEPGFGGI